MDTAPTTSTATTASDRTSSHASQSVVNALTVDVEDYFQVEAFRGSVDPSRWDDYELRVADNTRRLLDLLDEHEARATFFTLGWVARKCPQLVEEIVERGHELGCHSYWHRLIYGLTPHEFRDDTAEATRVLEDASGRAIRSYRAPCYSITPSSSWAFEILGELGYSVDSSVFPIRHDVYGFRSFPRFPVRVTLPAGGEITEFPMTTVRLLGANLPGPGGGYLRILPELYSRVAIERTNRRDAQPACVYVHPWEIDPEQPRLKGPLKSRFRHYTGLSTVERKLESLLSRFEFAPMSEALARRPPQGTYEAISSADCAAP